MRYGGWPWRGVLGKVGIISLGRYPFLDNLPQEGSLKHVSLSRFLGKTLYFRTWSAKKNFKRLYVWG